MQKKAVFALFALALVGCTPALKPEEVNEMLLAPTHGLIGGIAKGDSWEKIKADHDKRYKVRDDSQVIGGSTSYFRQLRHDLGSPGQDGFYISVQLDASNNIKSYGASIFGRHENAVVVRKVLDDVIAHFDKAVGNGHCGKMSGGQGNSSVCDWKGKDGTNVNVMYMEMSDPIAGTIEISVSPGDKG